MERLTARNKEGGVYFPHCLGRCNGECCKGATCEFDIKIAERLALYEDTEETDRLRLFPLTVGQKVYFIYEDTCDDSPIKGDWCISHPHKVLDVSFRGFWTGENGAFPLNADFTAWDEQYFLSYQEAKEAIEGMVIE